MAVVKQPIAGVVYPSAEDSCEYARLPRFEQITFPQHYASVVAAHGTRVAVTDSGGSYTHLELDDLSDRLATALLDLGLQPLDRAIFQIPNGRELVLAVMACLKAGIIPVCTLTAHRQAEIGYLARHSSARAHFIATDSPRFDFAAFASEMREAAPSLAFTIVTKGPAGVGQHGLQALIDSMPREQARARLATVARDPAQVAFFQLSGGTSGVPKIIPRFHNEYLYQIRSYAAFHGLDHRTVAFAAAPMMHNAPIVCHWGPAFFEGGEAVSTAVPTPDAMAALVRERRPNWASIPHPLLVKMVEGGTLAGVDLSQTTFVTSGNTAALARMTGARVVPNYGMTEGIITSARRSDSETVLTSAVGMTVDGVTDIRIVDPETGAPVPHGVTGEMLFRGPSSTRGYFDAADRNRNAFTPDGYCRSGDLMRIHVVGGQHYLSFEGRLKDIVNRGGEKINCQEVERALGEHPDIGAVATVPMSDDVYGERMCAFIVPAAGRTAPDIRACGAFLQQLGLAKYKWPERIEVVSEFPQTGSGKLSKPKLRELIEQMLGQERAASVNQQLAALAVAPSAKEQRE